MKHLSQPFELMSYNGAIALMGKGIVIAVQDLCQNIVAPSHPLHITLMTAAEYKHLNRPPLSSIDISNEHIYVLPPASTKSNNVSWLPIVWNHADVWRKSVGLKSKSYHITLSDTDDHSLDKSISNYVTSYAMLPKVIEEAIHVGLDALDHIVLNLSHNPAYSEQVATEMICSFPESYKGYLRLGDVVVATHAKLAALSYAQALALESSLLEYVSRRIRRLSNQISYGPIVTAVESERIPTVLKRYLFHPWPPELDSNLSQMLWTAPTTSRERNIYFGFELPRFFSWVYPGRIAGMSTPRHSSDINVLIDMGFTHVLSLTEESPLDSAWFHLKPIRHVYIPLENYAAPTLEEMDVIFEQICEGGIWLIHCGGGVGRAGTVIACLMTMLGQSGYNEGYEPQMDSKTSISLLRKMRPRSLESERQVNFVSFFVSHRWKIAHNEEAQHVEPNTALQVKISDKNGSLSGLATTTDVIFMVGKPGSGKSWLANAIAKRRGRTRIINQDSNGRAACEREISKNQLDGTLVILDRCNPKTNSRSDWLNLVPQGSRCIVIYFDYSTILCRRRINRRLDHPIIRPGRGENALNQMDREMESPQLDEGFLAVLHITSFQSAKDALILLTPTPPLLKFPRTIHLFDLGASGKDDIVLDQDFSQLTGHLTIEEKMDGANMGFSLDVNGKLQCQNRSHWVNSSDHAQFKPLSKWLDIHSNDLIKILKQDHQFLERYILYGEWMVAKHSIHYTHLTNHFLAFDLFDRYENTFVSRPVLNLLLRGTLIEQVPLILETEVVTKVELLDMISRQSVFTTSSKREGVYVRFENESRTQTINRGKVVRSDFIAGNDHWGKGKLELNSLITGGML